MQQFYSLENIQLEQSWLSIGTFDGVHLGHQAIIREMAAAAHAQGGLAVVMTFHPHPAVVLGRRTGAFYLTHPDERAAYLAELGVDVMIVHPFDRQVANLTASEFISLVKQHLGLYELWVGHDFALGHNREGDITRLESLSHEFDYRLHIVEEITTQDVPISSSRIRSLIREGDVAAAARLLGRPYHVNGVVIPGDGRGRTIGIPTANLDIWKEKLVPKPGVYVCAVTHGADCWQGVTNIGFRPTFENTPPEARLEVYILDIDQNLYGQMLDLEFYTRLRDEMRFPSVTTLLDQIQLDIRSTRDYFETQPEILH